MIEIETGLKTRLLIVSNGNGHINTNPLGNHLLTSGSKILPPLIVSHGFGAKDPKSKDHLSDHWMYPIFKCINDHCFDSENLDAVFYTSRGHGDTAGWQETANENYLQFTWENLAYDTIGIANYLKLSKFIACGNSMSASSSLYTAIKFPERVYALILIRVPTAWEARKVRKEKLLGYTKNKIKSANPHLSNTYAAVADGIAMSDLPPLDNDELYSKIKCPTLILSIPSGKVSLSFDFIKYWRVLTLIYYH